MPPWPRPSDDSHRISLYAPPLLICALFAAVLYTYHVPAETGVDQNGYIVTARLIAKHHRLSWTPADPLQFAGRMMVLAPNGAYYAKYPFGYPLLAALGWLIAGLRGAYAVAPLCAILACFFSFLLFRTVVSSLAAVMGVVWMACNPITLAWANDAFSHAPSLLCVVVGFWGLLRWLEDGITWRGLLGGFALGYACTIRYSEFLLVLPILLAVFLQMRRQRLPAAFAPLIGWSLPVLVLALVCWHAFGAPWRTGYSLSAEQTAFGWKYFLGSPDSTPPHQGNWETLLFQLNHTGLFMMLGVSIAGLIGMFWHSWKLAALLCLWVLPSTLLYMFYYWAPIGEDTLWYLRFFLTVLPGFLLAGLWIFDQALHLHRHAKALALGAVTVLGCGVNLANIAPHLAAAQEKSLAFQGMLSTIHTAYPPHTAHPPLIFTDEDACCLLDSAGGYELFDVALFHPPAFNQYRRIALQESENAPNSLQRARALAYVQLLGRQNAAGDWQAKSPEDLDAMLTQIIDRALAARQRVSLLLHGDPPWNMISNRPDLHLRTLATWREPATPPPPPGALLTRWLRGIEYVPPQRPQTPEEKRHATWTLYELTR